MTSKPFFCVTIRRRNAGPPGFFMPRLPAGDEVFEYIQVAGKYGLRDMLMQPDRPDLFRVQHLRWRQAGLVKFAYRLHVDCTNLMQTLHRFVDGRKSITKVFLSHLWKPRQTDHLQ